MRAGSTCPSQPRAHWIFQVTTFTNTRPSPARRSERQPDAVPVALARIAEVGRELADQSYAMAADRLLVEQHRGLHGSERAQRIVRRRLVLVAERQPVRGRLERDPHR